ncbi:MAG: hypothetical protein ABIT23_08505 [Nitrosospira sp.]
MDATGPAQANYSLPGLFTSTADKPEFLQVLFSVFAGDGCVGCNDLWNGLFRELRLAAP